MFRALIVAGILLVGFAWFTAPAETVAKNSSRQASANSASPYDAEAERQLLELANADRARLGLPALKMDEGLVRAARAHAAEMAARHELSHQFSGEPALTQRISANSSLHLDRTGENVAFATTADDAHYALMSSPPHRDNLLSANFNVAGMGVFRSAGRLYVAQDFGSGLATYSIKQAQELVAASVEQLRAQARMPKLRRVSDSGIQSSACAMAQADSLRSGATPSDGYTLRYTSMDPETIPPQISKVIAQRGLRTYSAGTCYARTKNYPTGAYWVVLEFF